MPTDQELIPNAIKIATTPASYAAVQKEAAQALMNGAGLEWPHNGCAANLSALLQAAGISVPMTLGAAALANKLGGAFNSRGWAHVPVGAQQAGDVGVALPDDPNGHHIYFVVSCQGTDQMVVADNQADKPHPRFASGKAAPDGVRKTPTTYFLRASGVVMGLPVASGVAPAIAMSAEAAPPSAAAITKKGLLAIDTDGAGNHHNDPDARDETSAMWAADGTWVFRYAPDGSPNPAGVRYLNDDEDEWAVAPTNLAAVNHGPLQVGDKATVVLPNGTTYSAKIGDFGPPGKVGEFSLKAIKTMGVQVIPTEYGPIPTLDGPAASDIPVTVTFHPGTA